MGKIEFILTDCIKEIKSGKATMKECLEHYPSLRRELEPLLKMALSIHEPPAFQFEPGYKQSAKAQLIQNIRTTKQKNSQSWADIFSFGLFPQLAWARVAFAVIIVVLVISILGGSTAYAAQSSLPGEALYPIKTGTEDVRIWMAGKSADKAELNLEFAQNRLEELKILAAGLSNKTGLAVDGYKNNLQAADSNIQSISDTSILAGVLEKFSQKLEEQISFCDSLFDTNSLDNPSLQEAATLAVNEQINLLGKLAQQNNLRAAQANLNMMQYRLQRARTLTNEHQYEAMREAMLQYQRFNELGQQILRNAHDTQNQASEIDNLSATVLQSCLETLNNMSQQVPQGYQNIIETSRDMTLQFQKQARYGYQPQGASSGGSDQAPNAPTTDDSSGTAIQQSPIAPSQPQRGTDNASNNNPVNTSTPTPGIGGNSDSGSGSGAGNVNPGATNTNKPDTTPVSTPNIGGNTGSGTGTGSGSGAGTGGSTNSPPGNTSGSSGGGKR